jgi:hypothetical protein
LTLRQARNGRRKRRIPNIFSPFLRKEEKCPALLCKKRIIRIALAKVKEINRSAERPTEIVVAERAATRSAVFINAGRAGLVRKVKTPPPRKAVASTNGLKAKLPARNLLW